MNARAEMDRDALGMAEELVDLTCGEVRLIGAARIGVKIVQRLGA